MTMLRYSYEYQVIGANVRRHLFQPARHVVDRISPARLWSASGAAITAWVWSASGSTTTEGQLSGPAATGRYFSGPAGRRTCRGWDLGQGNHIAYHQSFGVKFPWCRTRFAGNAGRASSQQLLGSSGATAGNGGSALLRPRCRFSLLKLGACPTLTFLLRQTMHQHLGCSRRRKILNVIPSGGSASRRAWGWAAEIVTPPAFLGTCRLTISPACANVTLLTRRVAHPAASHLPAPPSSHNERQRRTGSWFRRHASSKP